MPSFFNVSSKLTPAAAPPDALGYAMEFAASNVFLTASGVEMSGLEAPLRLGGDAGGDER